MSASVRIGVQGRIQKASNREALGSHQSVYQPRRRLIPAHIFALVGCLVGSFSDFSLRFLELFFALGWYASREKKLLES